MKPTFEEFFGNHSRDDAAYNGCAETADCPVRMICKDETTGMELAVKGSG